MQNSRDDALNSRVTEIADGKITMDVNHWLAGKDVTFVVQVGEVRKPATKGQAAQPGFTVQ